MLVFDVTKEGRDDEGGCKEGLEVEEDKVMNSTDGLDDISDKVDIVKNGLEDEGTDDDSDKDSWSLGELCLLISGDF